MAGAPDPARNPAQAEQTLRAGKQEKGGDRNGDKPAVLVYDADFELGLYLLNKKRDRLGELESKYNAHVEIHLKH